MLGWTLQPRRGSRVRLFLFSLRPSPHYGERRMGIEQRAWVCCLCARLLRFRWAGHLCGFVKPAAEPSQVWPCSQAIAKAKAYTANAFSLDSFALSTARLYTFTQPRHSLWSLGQSNSFNPVFLSAPGGGTGGNGQIAGGLIFFGGGVPIYANGGTKIVGGLGISGDTSCADHEIAKRVRHLLGMNPSGGPKIDDIQYSASDGPSVFTHPQCLNVKRNGVTIGTGTEANASGY